MNTQAPQDLKDRARELLAACRTLDTMLAEGAVRLRQEAEVERLRAMATCIRRHLEEAAQSENRAQDACRRAEALGGRGRALVKGIAVWEHAKVEAFEKTIAARRSGRQHCFGMVMVCVGKGGLPDDVNVVSISGRARDQNRSPSAIALDMQKRGALLFTPENFMQSVEGVASDIRKGKLRLPVLPEQLAVKGPTPIIIRIDV